MLAQLAIRDIVLIERLDLRFETGLSVLTGETGAGKSILLDAFALALGGRGDGSLVRQGETQGQVTAVFDVPSGHMARHLAAAADLDSDGDLILRRVQFADGRTRAFVNDQAVSVQTLKTLGASLVEIHGQHDDRALIDPAGHRAILDAHGALSAQVAAVAEAARRLRQLKADTAQREAALQEVRRHADYLRHAADELAALAPETGEEAELSERRLVMMQSEKVHQDLDDALQAVAGPGSPLASLAAVMRKLERRAGQAGTRLDAPLAAIDGALVALESARAEIEVAIRAGEFDPADLERSEQRLFTLRAASRKFSVPADELAGLCARFQAELAALDADESALTVARRDLAEADQVYLAAAEQLSAARTDAARELDRSIVDELPPLKLERARFTTLVESDTASRDPSGIDRVEFQARTNPGSRAGPLMKVVSGGELSRFILALKVVLAERGSAPTLVFDEIDTGVGGAVSDAIGQRLARLATRVQVMAITHAPQVAARATHHLLIYKEPVRADDRVATRVVSLDETPRREEIARMLAGASVTDEARAAALRLIDMGAA